MVSTGIDLVYVPRIKKALDRNPAFMTRYFTTSEIELFERRGERVEILAANFAVKEAFSKALGTGIRGFSLQEIEVLRNEHGAPFINLYGRARERFKESGAQHHSCSISHDGEYAVGMVLIL